VPQAGLLLLKGVNTKGKVVDDLAKWKGCARPRHMPMDGAYVRLEPLCAKKHGDGLFAAATEGDAQSRFRWLPEGVPRSRDHFEAWLSMVQASADPAYFTVLDSHSGEVLGRQTFLRMDPLNGVAEIGHIHWGPRMQRTPASTEAFYLFGKHLFEDLGYRRFEWKCNDRNEPSKRAALRYGMIAEGVHRQAGVIKGENRDTAWFSVLDCEWPVIGEAMRRWLSPDNFHAGGSQRERLFDLRAKLQSNA